jgi:hypothetical protein
MMRAVMLVLVAFVLTGVLAAQQPAFKRTVLQQSDISAPGREVVSAVAEFDPKATPGRTRISAKRLATCSKVRSSSSRTARRR